MIDIAITVITAREVFEGAMFTISHLGAVLKSPDDILTKEEKKSYTKWIIGGLIAGLISGLVISMVVGFTLMGVREGLEGVTQNLDNAFELGEGLSKLIGAIFVIPLCLKIPKWFGISNFVDDKENKVEGKKTMATSMFWNVLRETGECGAFIAMVVVASPATMSDLGPSVGVGIGSALLAGGIIATGAKFISAKGFAIGGAVICQLLAMGLLTGAVHSFEEFHEARGGEMSYVIWYLKDVNSKAVAKSFGWMGMQYEMTIACLLTWIFSGLYISLLQYLHNYKGYVIKPWKMRNRKQDSAAKANSDASNTKDCQEMATLIAIDQVNNEENITVEVML